MVKKVVPVDYTSRDFETIRQDLITYVRRYYPETYKDFNQASFGSLMMDLVSLVGDNLSFYLDYNANEAFMQTSLEYENVLMHAKQLGYKYTPARSSVGSVDIYVPVPADSVTIKPDIRYLPKILKGSVFSTPGGKTFTLNETVELYSEDIEVVGDQVSQDDAQRVEYYILKVKGSVISGEEKSAAIDIGDFQRFLKVEVPGTNIGEITSVTDLNNNEYYEVDYLSQNTVNRIIQGGNSASPSESSILKKFPVPRRFVTERDTEKTYLVFGYGSENEIRENKIADPAEMSLKISGKNYVSDSSFDPSILVSSEKFGVSPVNTTLTVNYRENTHENSNTAAGTITQIVSLDLDFRDEQNLLEQQMQYIRNNIQIYNEEPVNGDITVPTTEEIRRRSRASFATQSRAVTKEDYVSATYTMPSQLGAIKRCAVSRDTDDFRRNINIHVISEGADGSLEASSSVLKNNLRTWLNSLRVISDSIDIHDAILVNVGVEFDVIAQDDTNKSEVYSKVRQRIYKKMSEIPPELGEPLYISDIFKILKDVEEVLDVVNVKVYGINPANSTKHRANIMYDIQANLSPTGRAIFFPKDHIWELKHLSDIKGTVR